MNKKKKNASGIHLYAAKSKNMNEKNVMGEFLLFLFRIAAVWFLAFTWWNGFFNVFPVNIDERWLYVFLVLASAVCVIWSSMPVKQRMIAMLPCGLLLVIFFWKQQNMAAAINYLANAYLRVHDAGKEPLLLYNEPVLSGWFLGLLFALLTIPLLLVWSYTVVKNKGKVITVLLLLFPAILAAVEGYFLSAGSCWLIIFGVGVYFAISGGRTSKGAILGGLTAFACLTVLFLLSSILVKPIESAKTREDGLYLKARTVMKQNVVQKIANLAGMKEEKEQEKSNSKVEAPPEASDNIENDKEHEPDSNAPETTFQETNQETNQEGAYLAGGAQNLKSLAYFSPDPATNLTVVVNERPDGTYYYPEEYGGTYDGNSWEFKPLGETIYDEYASFPENLHRLTALCQEQDVRTAEDAARFIQQEFEENTVYDYHPGATPANQDFAEYFLFENKKGFCVHYATTATLMYRILGFQARYAQGYAIPVSAFEEQSDGTYKATVTGNMGHAWCETYEDGWKIREHTLPYLGDEPQTVPPAVNTSQNSSAEAHVWNKILVVILSVLFLFVLSISIFLIQATLRRQKKRTRCRKYNRGKGILATYQNIYEIAVFLGMEATEPTGAETFEEIKRVIPDISAEDWNWIQEIIWKTMFDKSIPPKEAHDKLYRMLQKLNKEIKNRLKGLEKIKYHHIKCLG